MPYNNINLSESQQQKAWREAEKALEEQNKLNKDMFIKLKEWLEKQNNEQNLKNLYLEQQITTNTKQQKSMHLKNNR